MNKLTLAILASAAALAIAPAAMADPITGTLQVVGSNNSNNPDVLTISSALVWTTTTGDFASAPTDIVGDTLTIAPFTGSLPEEMITGGPDGLSFEMQSYTIVDCPVAMAGCADANGSWDITGSGLMSLGTYTPTTYYFQFTSQPGETSTFSADANPAPEPNSLILLGTGLLGLAFVAFRKAKSTGLVLNM
jgi:hypothetical protein